MMFLLVGCAHEKRTQELPPLPWNYVPSKALLPHVEKFLEAQETRVDITWENQATPFASNYVTGVEATVDFQQWEEVARIPYTTAGIIQLTNRTEREFYRIYNALKGM